MLGKTANGLYWMYRYLERAENTARLIEAGQRIALTRLAGGDEEWGSVLQSADAKGGFDAQYDTLTKDHAIDWMLRKMENASSVLSCIHAARHNARLVRTAITGDVWEAVNGAYMATSELLRRKVSERDLPATLNALRENAALVRGVTLGTMLRNEQYDFSRIGTFLERADNTARILDVKYYVLLPTPSAVGTSLDNVQWESILRSLSARGGFRMEHGAGGGPKEIAQFLILDTRMPRSLAFCMAKLCDNLGYLSAQPDARTEAQLKAEAFRKGPLSMSIEEIFDHGLHEFLRDAQHSIAGLSYQIERDFRFYE